MPHRKDLIADFTAGQRLRLAALMLRFLTDAVVDEHLQVAAGSHVLQPNHEQFFRNHRAYISKLEGFLLNNGGGAFVPLPKWDDEDNIPDEFWAVKPKDNGTERAYLNRLYNTHRMRLHSLPDKVKPPQLCGFEDGAQITHELVPWHADVHRMLGGVMFKATPHGPDPTTEASAALIFWPWHAFNDEIYHNWERCKLSGCKSLAVGRNTDGRLEVFAAGTGGELWRCWQDATYGGWSLWRGGGGISKQIAVGPNRDGRLELFAIGSDDTVYHIWQPDWREWARLGGTIAQIKVKQIKVAQNQDGRLEVFAVGPEGVLHHIWQTLGGVWSGWDQIGVELGKLKQIAVGRNQDGRLEVFAVGPDNRVHQTWQRSPGSAWSRWLRSSLPLDHPMKSIAVGSNQDGRLELFAAGTDTRGYAQVWHTWQTAPNGRWRGWGHVTESTTLTSPFTQLAVEWDATGRLNLFALNDDGVLLYSRQRQANTTADWTKWAEPDSIKRFDSISIGKHSNGRLEVFGVVKADVIWHMWQWTDDAWERWQLL